MLFVKRWAFHIPSSDRIVRSRETHFVCEMAGMDQLERYSFRRHSEAVGLDQGRAQPRMEGHETHVCSPRRGPTRVNLEHPPRLVA